MNKRTKVTINENGPSTIENPPFKESVSFFCAAEYLSLHGCLILGCQPWTLVKGLSIKRQIFTLTSNLSVIRNKVAPRPVGGGIWVTGALRTLRVVPHNVHALPHQPRNAHLAQFVVCILHVCVASSRCGLKPLAQQVHLEPHLAKPMSATPSLLLCAAFLSKTVWCFFWCKNSPGQKMCPTFKHYWHASISFCLK